MIFFSEKKLARKLHEGQVTEKEQMVYLVLFNLIFAIFMTSSFSSGSSELPVTLYTYLSDALMITVTIGSIIYFKKLNDRGDKINFVSRYICLSLPIAVKVIPLGLILGGISFVMDNWNLVLAESYDSEIAPDQTFNMGPCSLFGMVILYVFLIWRYKVAFQIASGEVELK